MSNKRSYKLFQVWKFNYWKYHTFSFNFGYIIYVFLPNGQEYENRLRLISKLWMDVRVVYLTLALEDRIGEPCSNSGLICYVHFCKNVFGKGMKLSLLIHNYELKSKLSNIDLYINSNSNLSRRQSENSPMASSNHFHI